MPVPFTSLVLALPSTVPFTGPETLERERGSQFDARIGANESAFGISQCAVSAMRLAIESNGCSWYADPESFELRAALADKHQVEPDEICVDAGIDTLLGLAVRMLIEPGTPVVTSLGAYPTFNYHVNGFGGVLHTVPYRDNHEDSQALLTSAIQHHARLLYLANPDNPMGTRLSANDISSLVERLPGDCVLALDEAYIDFSSDQDALPIDTTNAQVMRFRTFSKAFGLAGMRVGYVIAHRELIEGFNKIRNHFGIGRLAQIAALESLRDETFLRQVQKKVAAGREQIYQLAETHDIGYVKSHTNFVALDLGSVQVANELLGALNRAGIFIRKPMVPPLDHYLRVGLGTEEEQTLFAKILDDLQCR